MSPDLRLVAVLDPSVLNGRDLLDAARAAEAGGGGATAIQLRMKGAPAGVLFRAVQALLMKLSVPLYVNDRADVAWAAGAAGVHLGQDDLPAGPLRVLLPPPFRIGVSVGSPGEGRAVSRAAADYWSVGPVYRTPTKPDAGAPLGPEGLGSLVCLAPRGMPVIGIGGISAVNAAEVIRAGAAGVAVISAVFAAADIDAAARGIRAAVDRAL